MYSFLMLLFTLINIGIDKFGLQHLFMGYPYVILKLFLFGLTLFMLAPSIIEIDVLRKMSNHKTRLTISYTCLFSSIVINFIYIYFSFYSN